MVAKSLLGNDLKENEIDYNLNRFRFSDHEITDSSLD